MHWFYTEEQGRGSRVLRMYNIYVSRASTRRSDRLDQLLGVQHGVLGTANDAESASVARNLHGGAGLVLDVHQTAASAADDARHR